MTTIFDTRDRFSDDPWIAVADDAPLPPDTPAIVSLARLAATPPPPADPSVAPLGVRLAASDKPDALAPFLDRVALVELTMASFRDGRVFTQARALREYHRYAREIRVAGHVLPDQVQFLRRCGVDAVVLPDGTDVVAFAAGVSAVSIVYQPAIGEDHSVPKRGVLP